MPGVVRAITRIQDADDFSGTLTDTYIPVWSNSQQKFVMTAQSSGGAPGGSTTQVQYNSSGAFAGHSGFTYDGAGKVTLSTALVAPVWKPASDSATALRATKADGTAIFTVNTTDRNVVLTGAASATEGANLVTNGTFDVDASWTKGSEWTIAAGVASKSAGTASNLTQNLGESAGKMYRVRFDYTRSTGNLSVSIGGVTHTTTFNAASGSADIYVLSANTGDLTLIADASFSGTVDNVVVTEIAQARSSLIISDSLGTETLRLRSSLAGTVATYDGGIFNTTGGYWNAFGWRAGYLNTTGGYWNAFGQQAGYSNTTGGHWNAFGQQAGYSNTTGNYWNAFGQQAGYLNTTGGYWNAFGQQALYLSNGVGNQGFGFQAGDNLTSACYSLVIGYDLDAPSATADWQMNIQGQLLSDGSALWLRPRANTTTGIQLQNAAGTPIVSLDTVSSILDITGTLRADSLRIDVSPTFETVICTHTITFSANGTNYKIPCVLA